MNIRRRIRQLEQLRHLDGKVARAVRERTPDSSFYVKDIPFSTTTGNAAKSMMQHHQMPLCQPSVHVVLCGRPISVPVEPTAYRKWFNEANQCFKASVKIKLRVWTLRAPIQDDCWTSIDNCLYYTLNNQLWEAQAVSFDDLPAE